MINLNKVLEACNLGLEKTQVLTLSPVFDTERDANFQIDEAMTNLLICADRCSGGNLFIAHQIAKRVEGFKGLKVLYIRRELGSSAAYLIPLFDVIVCEIRTEFFFHKPVLSFQPIKDPLSVNPKGVLQSVEATVLRAQKIQGYFIELFSAAKVSLVALEGVGEINSDQISKTFLGIQVRIVSV